MIPKKIHYCWFGGKPLPPIARKCLASWKKYCPDYEIIEWNEKNYDLTENEYVRWCYANKKWAYLSDYVRLAVVNAEGGIYFDTDVELIRRIDRLLVNEAFFAFENDQYVASGLGFGAEAGHDTVRKMMEPYAALREDAQGHMQMTGCPILNTEALLPLGLRRDGTRQTVAGALILPADFMNPYDDAVGKLNRTKNTISIHWYAKSALPKSVIARSRVTRIFHRIFGVHCFDWLKRRKK